MNLCDACANREAGKLKRLSIANSLNVPGSRRNSTDQLLQSSSRRSSHAVHPANPPNLRRLSGLSQSTAQPSNVSSSRKSSKCDEKCLSRRSSNINQNAISTSKNVLNSRRNSGHCTENITTKKEVSVTTDPMESNPRSNKDSEKSLARQDIKKCGKVLRKTSNPGLIVTTVLVNKDQTELSPPRTESHIDCKSKEPLIPQNLVIPAMPKRRHSSSNLLSQATVHCISRRSSCVPPPQPVTKPPSSKNISESTAKVID